MTSQRASGTDASLRDRAEIVELTHRYCWALDDRDWDALRNLFTPDATADLGVRCADVDAIVEQCRGFLSTLDSSHHLVANHLIELAGGGAATCRCYFQAQHTVSGLEGGDNWILGGRYVDRLRRTTDGWRIERRDLIGVWSDGNPAILAGARR